MNKAILCGHTGSVNIPINVGGDTYCYGASLISCNLNIFASTNKIKSALWGCSIYVGIDKNN